MSMAQYEERRENLWKEAYKNDPAFYHGESPAASVISFFCKRRESDPIVDITKCTPKVVDYEIVVDIEYLRARLNHTIKYKKKWNDHTIYTLGALQEYLDMCDAGNYKKGIISKTEFASIAGKK
jgi:hypothetical protein